MIRIGTCSWVDHKGFYPPELERPSRQKERLTYYAQFFDVVEADTTFYGRPKPSVTQGWVDRTPDGFTFDVKAYKSLTRHERENGVPRLPTREEEQEFLELLKPLRDAGRLGAVEYQFPSWFTRTVANRDVLLEARERHPNDRVAFEFRHRSWFAPEAVAEIQGLIAELDATLVAADAPQVGEGTVPRTMALTSPHLAIVRLHGRNAKTWYIKGGKSWDRFDYTYSREELEQWAKPIAEAARDRTVHVLINTNRDNQGPINAYRMADVLGVELPPAPFEY